MDTSLYINSIESLEETYHSKIPISKHMGIKVKDYNGTRLTIVAPLSNNINHQNSAFGGSLFSLAALAGWGLLQLKMAEENLDCNTVIAGGDVEYMAPIFADFSCECSIPEKAVYDVFLEKLHKKSRASLQLEPNIFCDGKKSMKFSGHYVLSLSPANQ